MSKQDIINIKRKKKLTIPVPLILIKLWSLIGPTVAKEIGGSDYNSISSLMDCNAYYVGYIFVQTAGQTSCFGNSPLLRVLGPIKDYINKRETDKKWQANEFPVVKKLPEHKHFDVILEHNENELSFEGLDYYFLSIPEDMVLEKSVKIDRSTDEDLYSAEWFGIIRDVVVTRVFQMRVETKTLGRVLEIGDAHHTILFTHEIYQIDSKARVKSSTSSLTNLQWEGLQCDCQDGLPLPTF